MDESKIIFYHLPTCPQCGAVERMLNSKGVSYTSCMDKDVMISRGIKSTPTLEVDGERLTGVEIRNWIRGIHG